VQTIVARLLRPHLDTGALSVVEERNEEEQLISLSVVPRDPACARVTVAWEESGDLAYVTVGECTHLEVPIEGGRYSDLPGEEELLAVIAAVAEGRFSETVWHRNGWPIKASATLTLGKRRISVRTGSVFRIPFTRTTKSSITYRPYPVAEI
jgi:hypothetical protein